MVQGWEEGDGSMLGRRGWFDAGLRDGLMLGRKGWFDTRFKGTVQCWVEGDGSMLG